MGQSGNLKASLKGMVTLMVSAASNIDAGTMVAVLSGTAAGAVNKLFTLGDATTGFGNTGILGHSFIGVLEKSVSANESPITVFTEGVYRFLTDADWSSTANNIGHAVGISSGKTIVGYAGVETGEAFIGTLVKPAPAPLSAQYVDVKIKPAVWRWTVHAPADSTASASRALSWPKYKQP